MQQTPLRQLRGAPMLVVERVRQHFDIAVAELEAQLGPHLEVPGQHPRARVHLLQLFAHCHRQRLPASEIARVVLAARQLLAQDRKSTRKSTRLNSSHSQISYAVFCLKKKKK